MIEGIDISAHQAHTPSLTGKAFVIARATYGAHGDSRYLVHQINVRKAGKVFGAYHFARPVTTGDTVAEQVRAFLLMAKDADLLALDVEEDVFVGGDGVRRSNGTMTRADARAFIAAVHKAGRRIGLYISAAHFFDAGQDFDWIAKWGTVPPTRHWDIWQYDGGGADRIDNDRFDGTVAQLKALGAPTIPDTSEAPSPVGPVVTDLVPFSGTATFKNDGKQHGAIRANDGEVRPLPTSTPPITLVAKALLAEPWPDHPSRVVYLMGSAPAWLLAEDIDIKPIADPTPYSSADVEARVAAAIKTDRAAAKIVWP